MSTRGRSSTIPRTAFIVGVAAAGAAFWMAGTTDPDVATTSPEVELASIGSPMLRRSGRYRIGWWQRKQRGWLVGPPWITGAE